MNNGSTGYSNIVKTLQAAFLLLAAFAFAACGGGGGGGGGNNVGSGGSSSSSSGGPAPTSFTGAGVEPGGDAAHPKKLAFTWELDDRDGRAAAIALEVNPDGDSGFSGDGLPGELNPAAGRAEIEVALHLTQWREARYQLVALDESGSELARSDELTLEEVAVAAMVGYFKSPAPQQNATLGASLAISADGKTLLVGSPQATADPDFPNSGTVLLYEMADSGWQWLADIPHPNSLDSVENFGEDVAMSANGALLLASAPLSGGAGNAVFVARDLGDPASQEVDLVDIPANMEIPNTNIDVAVAGEPVFDFPDNGLVEGSLTIAVSGRDTDSLAGLVHTLHVFRDEDADDIVSTEDSFSADDASMSDGFGSVLDLSSSGELMAVAADGVAYIFARKESGEWQQRSKLAPPVAPEAFARIGNSSMALSDDGEWLAAMGADKADEQTQVYLWQAPGADWDQAEYRGTLEAFGNQSNADLFGHSLSFSADSRVLAVGAPLESGNTPAVGGELENPGANLGAGAVFTFVLEAGEWQPRNYIKAPNAAGNAIDAIEGDGFGAAVALSADGSSLTVSAALEDGGNAGNEGIGADQSDNSQPNSGAVYVY